MAMTTIKVPAELRDRINDDARAQGLTAAAFIDGLVTAFERHRRMEEFGRAVRSADASYWDEMREWDAVSDLARPHD